VDSEFGLHLDDRELVGERIGQLPRGAPPPRAGAAPGGGAPGGGGAGLYAASRARRMLRSVALQSPLSNAWS
jgi:hypothetical protein